VSRSSRLNRPSPKSCCALRPGFAQFVVCSKRIDHRTEFTRTFDVVLNDDERHMVAVVDGSLRIITFITAGRFHPSVLHVNAKPELTIGKSVEGVRIYNLALRTSEAIASFRAISER
jgi:hypothetical protein